jgi:hypothetical protein
MQAVSPRAHNTFKGKRSSLDLWRLQDAEYDVLRDYSFPIQEDVRFLWQLMLDDRREGAEELMLAKVLVALEEDYGPCSTDVDPYKQTFAFRFLAQFSKEGKTWPYLLSINDFRGSLELRFYRVIDGDQFVEASRDYPQDPIESEMGADEIRYWMAYLWGFLHAGSKSWCRFKVHMKELAPFFRHIDSNHIIYGFLGGEFLEYEINDSDEYHAEVARLYREIRGVDDSPGQQIEITRSLVEAICSTGGFPLSKDLS